MSDAHANFAYSTVAIAPSPASSGTSLTVHAGDGAKFPTVPFNATVWPAGESPLTTTAEIVRVTAISTDTFTITRTQESTSARTIGAGDQIAATITAKTLTDVESRPVNSQTGASYAIADADRGGLTTFNHASAVAVSLAQAGTGGNFADGWFADYTNLGAGTATFTPATSTINGAATYAITTGQSVRIVSDGTNYQVTGVGGTPSASSLALRDFAINGTFSLWQCLGPNNSPIKIIGTLHDIYFCDQWKGNNVSLSGPQWYPSRSTASPHFAPQFLALTNENASADKVAIWQPLESWISQYLSNASIPVTITFYAKISSTTGSPKLNFGLLEWSGTADSLGGNVSGNVYSAWSTTTGTDPTWAASYAMNGKVSQALTTGWTKFTATITPDASKNNLLPIIWLDYAVANGVVLSVSDFSIVPNAPVPIPDPDLLSPQRFFWKSFANDTAPATGLGLGLAGDVLMACGNSVGLQQVWFPVKLRIIPTVTTYNPVSANANWRQTDNNADLAIGTYAIGIGSICLYATVAPTAGKYYEVGAVADARL